jgi:fatty-acyl-CoA synthase
VRTLSAALVDAANGTEGVRFVDRNETSIYLPYGAIFRRAQGVAAALQEKGVRAGDVVAIVLPTSAEFYDAFFGAILLGAVPVALYPPLRLGRLQEYHVQTAHCLQVCAASIVLTNSNVLRLLGQAIEAARPIRGCLCVEHIAAQNFDAALGALDEVAFLQFSSGTTSAPKAVALTHRQVAANMTAIASRIYREAPLPPGVARHTAVSWLPLYHDMGLVGCMLTAMYEQTTLTLIPPEHFVTKPSIWLRTIARYRATVSAAPNFAYSLCAERITPAQMEGVDLATWQVALNGAEAVEMATIQNFTQRFAAYGFDPKAMTPVYGLAEAALGVTFGSPRTGPRVTHFDPACLEHVGKAVPKADGQAFVSVGTPLDGYDVRIVGDSGVEVPVAHKGHIQARGPSVAYAYARAVAADGIPLADGWLATGDVGFFWQENLYVVGRHKDLIIIRGRNIAPHPIEKAVSALDGVRTGCVVAASHRPAGHATEALIVLAERRTSASPTVEDTVLIKAIEAAVLACCHIKPHTVYLCAPGTLPRTSSGKLRRQAAVGAFLKQSLTAPAKVSLWRMGVQMWRSKAALRRAEGPAP